MKERIEAALAGLVGKPLWECRRAADMAMFHFGERKPSTTIRGEPTDVGDYALHVQCAWRITRNDRVITARRDMYYPADGGEPKDGFDWQRQPNLQDKLIEGLFRQQRFAPIVQAVAVAEAGRLHFQLSGGFGLDVMPDDSTPGEHWRLFVPGSDRQHFVLTGNGFATE